MLLSKNSKKLEVNIVGFLLVVLVIMALLAGFDKLSMELFGVVSFVAIAVVLLKVYFGWLPARLGLIFVSSVVILLVSAGWVAQPEADKDKYQAVFLTNGQVYFGKLEDANSKHPVLLEVYYLQSSQQNPQTPTSQQNQQQTKLSLVKLGNELHGPTDKMVLRGDQILFWEDLKDDGQVVKLINENKNKK